MRNDNENEFEDAGAPKRARVSSEVDGVEPDQMEAPETRAEREEGEPPVTEEGQSSRAADQPVSGEAQSSRERVARSPNAGAGQGA